MIPFTWPFRKGKTVGAEADQWLPVAEHDGSYTIAYICQNSKQYPFKMVNLILRKIIPH